jgi:hypothetical protein
MNYRSLGTQIVPADPEATAMAVLSIRVRRLRYLVTSIGIVCALMAGYVTWETLCAIQIGRLGGYYFSLTAAGSCGVTLAIVFRWVPKMTDRVLARVLPGFRLKLVARHQLDAAAFEEMTRFV